MNELVNKINGFSESEWIFWLNLILDRLPSDPSLDVHRTELHQRLAVLYEQVNTQQRQYFINAIAKIFESTVPIPVHAEKIYYLLQLIAYLRPLSSKSILKRHLFDRVMLDMMYGNQNLNTLLLTVFSKYEIDEELIDFIFQTDATKVEFNYLIVCFRILRKSSPSLAFSFINIMVPLLGNDTYLELLKNELRYTIKLFGYRSIFSWYNHNFKQLQNQFSEKTILLDNIISNVARYENTINKISLYDKNYYDCLQLILNADKYNLTPNQIVSIARRSKSIGVEPTINLLLNIWSKSSHNYPSNRPWYFTDLVRVSNSHEFVITNDLGKEYINPDEQEVFEIFDSINEIVNTISK